MRKRFRLLIIVVAGMFMVSCKGYNDCGDESQQLYIGDDIAVAKTEYGKVRGYILRHIYFWLHNTDVMLTHTGGGKRPKKLSNRMSDALLAFMRTGNPNCKSLPDWPEYTPENGEVMILDDECIVRNDPDREARKVLESIVNAKWIVL